MTSRLIAYPMITQKKIWVPLYWPRISWHQKRLHKTDKKVKGRGDRLRKSLKYYNVDQEEIVRQACLLFYEYKQEKATICYRAQLDPTA